MVFVCPTCDETIDTDNIIPNKESTEHQLIQQCKCKIAEGRLKVHVVPKAKHWSAYYVIRAFERTLQMTIAKNGDNEPEAKFGIWRKPNGGADIIDVQVDNPFDLKAVKEELTSVSAMELFL
jgi:hypothetical protein